MTDASPAQSQPSGAPLSGRAIPLALLAVSLFLYQQRYLTFLASSQSLVGTDYCYFLPHLLAGDYWFASNGPLAVPWMTPSFCGGIPFYANPQSIYYSPAQWLSFVVDPLTAVRWSILLFVAAGGIGTYLLLRRSFGASVPAALFASTVFLFNGFYSHRMLIGHFAFVSFMLVPAMAALLIGGKDHGQWLARGLGAGLLAAMMFQSGLVILFVPCGMAILFLMVLASMRTGGGWMMVRASVVAGVTAASLCVAKFVSAAAFVSNFARDFYPLPGVESVGQLLSVVFTMLFGRSEPGISKVFTHGRIFMRLHEWEYSLSPAPLVMMLLGLGFLIVRRVRGQKNGSPLVFDVRVAVLGLLLFIPLALNYYSPAWTEFLKSLPVISSMQSLSRFFAFYIPVVAVVAGLSVDLLPLGSRPQLAFLAICVVVAWQLTEELTDNKHLPQRWYEAGDVQKAWQELHDTGQVKPIDQLALLIKDHQIDMINGENALARGASARNCYEPIFGYDLKKFPVQSLHVGAWSEVTDGDLNVKNPACFLYPKENACRPGAHFSEAQKAEAEAFLNYRPVAWNMPLLQRLANGVNLLALVVVPGLLAWTLRRRRQSQA